jgi:SAM-dependent methyltransferase
VFRARFSGIRLRLNVNLLLGSVSSMAETVTSRDGHAFDLRPISCPTCGEEAAQRVLGMRGGPYHRYGDGVATRIVQCRTCSLIFPNPFPYPLALADLYGDPSRYFAGRDEIAKVAGQRPLVRDLVERSRVRTPALIDVGSGRGELLLAAREEGLTDMVGLEVSQAMIECARRSNGVTVILNTIEQYAASAARTFDIVALNAVLEHVHDPSSMIASVAALTRRGSILYIDVPNEPSLLTTIGNGINRIQGKAGVFNLSPTWPPYHVYGFNERALNALLTKYGFVIEEVLVRAHSVVPSNGQILDRMRSIVGTQINRIANYVHMAANMYVWARRA